MRMRKVWCWTLLFLLVAGNCVAGELACWRGGVGEEERAAAPDGNLKVVLFREGGKFITDVELVVFDNADQVLLRTKAEGPWLIMTLPPGAYSVAGIRANGDRESARFTIGGSRQVEVALMFPAP